MTNFVDMLDFPGFWLAGRKTVLMSMVSVVQGWKVCKNAVAAFATTAGRSVLNDVVSHLLSQLPSWKCDLAHMLILFHAPGCLFLLMLGFPGDRLGM